MLTTLAVPSEQPAGVRVPPGALPADTTRCSVTGRAPTPMWHQGTRARHAGGHGPPFAVNALLRYVRCPTLRQWRNRLSDSHRSRSIRVGGYGPLLH